jgi:long-chain fatty acid transport protein
MKNIRKQANITRYIQIASRGLPQLRPTLAKLGIVSKNHIFSTRQLTGGGVMKKLFVFLCVVGLIAATASPLFAGGIDNKHNWSAEWVRSLNRNAATDSADAVSYNPAGVMKMDDGFYLNLTGQLALKDYSNTEPNTAPFSGTEYSTDEPDFVPSLFGLYKQDKWAAYGAVTIVVAGGKIDFENGDVTTAGLGWTIIGNSPLGAFTGILDHYIKGKSYFIGYTIGGAYKINDMVSVSLGARYVDASREFQGYATLGGGFAGTQTYSVDYEETGDGWGGILGVNIAPSEELNIGLRYETKTSIDLETDVTTNTLPGALNPLITDGFKRNRDLPALLGLGVSYKFTPKIRVEGNLTYYFNDDADWENVPITSGDETQKDDGYDIGIAFEYTFNPKWKASVGYMYTDVGIDPDNMSVETPELDANTIAAGVAFKPAPNWDLNLGILESFYKDDTTSTGIKFEKDVIIIAVGVQYKFF